MRMPSWKEFALPFGEKTNSQYAGQAANSWMNAMGNMAGGLAGGYSQNYGNYTQGLTGLAGAQANEAASRLTARPNLATSRANERGSYYGANAMAEAARQAAVSNIATSALGAYGGATNSALSAWATNQAAYQKALSDMQAASQTGMSNYGVSRNNALGQLAQSYGGLGKAQMAANAIGNIDFGGLMGGGGLSVSNPSGSVASGSYGGGGGGGGGGLSFSSSKNSGAGAGALSGLGRTGNAITSMDVPDRLGKDAQAGRDQLERGYMTSRNDPSRMMNQALGGLLTLGDQGYGQSGAGMNQYYANTRLDDSYYNRASRDIKSVRGIDPNIGTWMREGFGTANNNIGELTKRLGFLTPEEEYQSEANVNRMREAERSRAVAAQRAASEARTRSLRDSDDEKISLGYEGMLARANSWNRILDIQSQLRTRGYSMSEPERQSLEFELAKLRRGMNAYT